jgi:23S rRNA (cytosine1962-C5)-methyltransferase
MKLPQDIEAFVVANLAASKGDACRLFHGRGRTVAGWEQVSIDYFHPLILLTLFEEVDSDWLQDLTLSLQGWAEPYGIEAVAMQSRGSSASELQVLWGELPRKPVALERGLQFALQLEQRQNVGFFLDMAQARHWISENSNDKRVLNLFAYTCAFSLVARSAGAAKVVNLDMSSAALRLGQQNHQRNGIVGGVSYLAHNLFRSWSKLRRAGPFDLLIVDPPSRQPGSFVVEKDYARVIRKLPELCAPGAELLLCLNSPHLESSYLMDMVQECAPQLEYVERLPNPVQFADTNPELSLKVLRFRYSDLPDKDNT